MLVCKLKWAGWLLLLPHDSGCHDMLAVGEPGRSQCCWRGGACGGILGRLSLVASHGGEVGLGFGRGRLLCARIKADGNGEGQEAGSHSVVHVVWPT
ncbi:hypothetical protein B0T11DRAFT_276848 [Plectosphaerella cucumerina]|jgi:hypothetical protein|uniref:Secreted protein n=1 Tax=Plectosphaerella cucumerina TaxID=40658 RepID=A0A8K0TNA8_9PEZI|nr:hypothetical protein B0T11DRAFT_276848 [Plectosphaerella cucumerina]